MGVAKKRTEEDPEAEPNSPAILVHFQAALGGRGREIFWRLWIQNHEGNQVKKTSCYVLMSI
jgi:hypothetical protein